VGSITGLMSQMGGVMGDVGNVIGSAFSGFATGGPAGAALGAGAAILGTVTQGIQSCVKEATASEAVWASLGAAVERSGASWASLKSGTETALLAMSKFTTYSDEQVAATMEKLMTFGLSYDQAMKALGPTLDFAAAKHMDLESAATLVGKAVDGNTAIMKRYGVDVTVAKDAADKMTPVLTALNDQFGGAAQAAASTYAGIQERLKNATQEVSEKIGNMFLPALASLTEGMIPVVDSLGKGIDSVSAWLTEVGKMPEVKAATDAIGSAFEGLGKWFEDVGRTAAEMLGPALKELWGALKEIWDALQPLFEAFGELWGVFSEGEGSGNALKDVLGIVVVGIRAIATVIKDVAPYIKAFATAFKDAAEFITPVLVQIKTAVEGFLSALRTAFEGFYNWLIGRSLWIDLWNQVLAVMSQMIGQLLSDLTSKLFMPMQNAFTVATEAVKALWNATWQMMQTILTGAMQLIQGNWQTGLATMQGALTAWGGAVTGIITGIMGQLQGAVSAGVSAIQGMFNALVASAQGALATIQGLFAQAQSLVSQMAQGIVSITEPATDQFQNLFNQAAAGVVSAGQQLYNMLVGGSIWPDMFNTMGNITSTTMASIQSTVQSGFASTIASAKASLAELQAIQRQAAAAFAAQPSAATYQALSQAAGAAQLAQAGVTSAAGAGGGVFGGSWTPSTPMNLSAAGMADFGQKLADAIFTATIGRSPTGGPATAQEMLHATLPISVVVDGVTMSRVTEQRMISQRQLAGG
jgi:phage-related protein